MSLGYVEAQDKFNELYNGSSVGLIRLFVKNAEVRLEWTKFENINVTYIAEFAQISVYADTVSYAGYSLFCYNKQGSIIAIFDIDVIDRIEGFDDKGALIE